MSCTHNESVNTVEPINVNLEFVTPTRPISQIEPNAPNRHDQINTLTEQFDEQTIEEEIVTPKIQRIPLDMDDNIVMHEDHEDHEDREDHENYELEYIHYCGDRDCEGDCGVLVCGCIDTCRNRCGLRDDYYY